MSDHEIIQDPQFPDPVEPQTQTDPASQVPVEKDESRGQSEEAAATAASADSEHEPMKRLGGFQRKLQRAEDEIARLHRLLEDRQPQTTAAPAVPAPAVLTGKPKAEDFDKQEDYVEALTDWKLRDVETRKEIAAAQQLESQRASVFEDRWNKAADTIPDFDDVMLEAKGRLALTPTMQSILIDMDKGPEVTYHLAKQPAEALRISKLSPMAAGRALWEIEKGLTTAAVTPIPVTKAPKPPEPIRGGATIPTLRPGEARAGEMY